MNTSWQEELEDLVSAEDFLEFFAIPYAAGEVQVKRLHILQRFHDYLNKQEAGKAPDYAAYRHWLLLAYQDLVRSDAQAEKVFAVFQRGQGSSFMPLTRLLG